MRAALVTVTGHSPPDTIPWTSAPDKSLLGNCTSDIRPSQCRTCEWMFISLEWLLLMLNCDVTIWQFLYLCILFMLAGNYCWVCSRVLGHAYSSHHEFKADRVYNELFLPTLRTILHNAKDKINSCLREHSNVLIRRLCACFAVRV